MTLAEKLRALREEEGRARGLGRALSKADVSRLMRAELGTGLSAAYISQLETGVRVHLSSTTRDLFAAFFQVHPGHLVSDSAPQTASADSAHHLSGWLRIHAQQFQHDYLVAKVLTELSARAEPRRYFEVLDRLLLLSSEQLDRVIERDFYIEPEPA
ncbi:MAG: helix-turn-helix transcriptional regulator [Chloroflexia bacterium]|nr:helix-turn-helix transcriptional regulator [Chloroflexia bacterium]